MATVSGNQKGSPAQYEYIDKDIAKEKQPRPELNYDYAINTQVPRINLKTQPNSNSSRQPELNYDYAANTDIPRIPLNTKPGGHGSSDQPELKYDYATNTEIPKINAAKPDLKYDYAINTEIPRINLNPQTKTNQAVNPTDNPTYDTLEEPNAPPPHYATLEDPAAKTKSLVTYDTPHSGDPVYNVLEKSDNSSSKP
mgnify:FL=1